MAALGASHHAALAQARDLLGGQAEQQLQHLLGVPHDYVFNQGPGGIQMLLWHDRRFQGLALEP